MGVCGWVCVCAARRGVSPPTQMLMAKGYTDHQLSDLANPPLYWLELHFSSPVPAAVPPL
eukprot:COSAG05_NODE_15952_length_357_cov_0.794574_1_plen_59_part_10